MFSACCCEGAPLATLGTEPRVDSDGQPACEDCGRRLSRCKGKLHKSGAGHSCHLCYMPTHRTQSSAAPALAPAPAQRSPKRKATSDPGEQLCHTPPIRPQAATRRVSTLSHPTPQRTTRQDEKITRLLEETHARRMAAIASDDSSGTASR